MSHATVLVITPTGDTAALEAALQPFHEYECTGVDDQYVVDVDITEETQQAFERHKDEGQTFEDFAKEWTGNDVKDGKVFRRTNPNKKWDWWQIGGRWKGMLIPKAGAKATYVGSPGLMGSSYSDATGNVDACAKADLDLDAMRKIAVENRRADVRRAYDAALTATRELVGLNQIEAEGRIDDASITAMWQELVKKHGELFKAWEDAERPGRFWPWAEQQDSRFAVLVKAKIAGIGPWDFYGADVPPEEPDPFAWCDKATALSTLAFLGTDGVWRERGEMGWFGVVHDEKKSGDWEAEYKAALDAVPDDHWVWVVDYHI